MSLISSSARYFLSYLPLTVLNPPTEIEVTVLEQSITSNWRTPEGNSDAVTVYCEGSENAVSKSVRVSSEKQTATCSQLTAGAIYDVILESSLNGSGLAPAVNSTDVTTVVTGNTGRISETSRER